MSSGAYRVGQTRSASDPVVTCRCYRLRPSAPGPLPVPIKIRTAGQPPVRALTCGFVGTAYRNRTDDLFITRELHTHKALDWPAIAAPAKATQPSQNNQTEVMYAQNAPMRTPLAVGT